MLELLVVIGILAAAAGIAIPAVLKTRDAAYRGVSHPMEGTILTVASKAAEAALAALTTVIANKFGES